jgi:hypothetical protein
VLTVERESRGWGGLHSAVSAQSAEPDRMVFGHTPRAPAREHDARSIALCTKARKGRARALLTSQRSTDAAIAPTRAYTKPSRFSSSYRRSLTNAFSNV